MKSEAAIVPRFGTSVVEPFNAHRGEVPRPTRALVGSLPLICGIVVVFIVVMPKARSVDSRPTEKILFRGKELFAIFPRGTNLCSVRNKI